jgi:antitoxin component HigA of HigAB toxin-antitoxin module
LGDDRFQELIRGASAFFAAAERDEVAERAAAIEEIKALMNEYGLTAQDLEG